MKGGQLTSQEHSQPIMSHSQGSHFPAPTATHSKFICCWYAALTVWLGEVEDVVAQHCQCNCGLCLPANAWLLAVCDQQTSEASRHVGHSSVHDPDDLEAPISTAFQPAPTSQTSPASTDIASAPLPIAPPVVSGIVSNANSDPSQLQFYTPAVCDVIECAKQILHCDIASVNSFPLHMDFNHKAVEYVSKAITECCTQGLPIPEGKLWFCSRNKTNILDGPQRVVATIYSWHYKAGMCLGMKVTLSNKFFFFIALGRSQQLVFCP